MKKLLTTTAILLSLSAHQALADSNSIYIEQAGTVNNQAEFIQYGSGNVAGTEEAPILQVGSNSFARIYQGINESSPSTGATAVLEQHGDSDYAYITQVGGISEGQIGQEQIEGNGGNFAEVYQLSNLNYASVFQLGNGNETYVQQVNNGDLGYEAAYLYQGGNDNSNYVWQYGTGDTATINQYNSGNRGLILQGSFDTSSSFNSATINQTGYNGYVYLLQEGQGHSASISDAGTNNYATSFQYGTLNSLVATQGGISNSLVNNQEGSGNEAMVTQVGEEGSVYLNQTGSDGAISVTQGGFANTMTVNQSGTGGGISITQN